MKDKETIKEVYDKLKEIEQIYIMPISVYNEIINKIMYLEDCLKESRRSRDVWKNKYKELKLSHKVDKATGLNTLKSKK